MKRLLLFTLTFAMSAALLAGCGSNGEKPSNSQSENSESNTIDVLNGTMPVPESHDNFIVLSNDLLEHFTALGVTPKAAAVLDIPDASTDSYTTKYYYDGPDRVHADADMENIKRLPTSLTEDLEAILALGPDFIVVGDRYEQYLEKFEEIAPTYMISSDYDAESGEDAWKQKHRLFGKLLGKEDLAEANIKAYEELVEKYHDAAADKVKGKTALVMQLNPKGFKVRMEDSQPQIYRELGFSVPEGLTKDFESTSILADNGSFPIEALAPFDPDYIFIDIQSEEDFEIIKDTPIWKNLKAVKNGNVMEISHFVWVQSAGPISKTLHLTDAAEFILNGTRVTSNPIIE